MYTVVKDDVSSSHETEDDALAAAHRDYRGHKSVTVFDPDEHRIWYSELSKDGREVFVWSRKRETL